LQGTRLPLPDFLHDAARDRVDAIAGASRPPPKQARAVERAEVGEVVHVVDGLDGDRRADLEPARLGAVTHEAGAALQVDEGDVER
jgi:hypothetical protein